MEWSPSLRSILTAGAGCYRVIAVTVEPDISKHSVLVELSRGIHLAGAVRMQVHVPSARLLFLLQVILLDDGSWFILNRKKYVGVWNIIFGVLGDVNH